MDKFFDDLKIVYNEISRRNDILNSYFELAKGKDIKEAKELVDSFLAAIDLPKNEQSTVASLTYLINLREDKLITFMDSLNLTQEQKDKKLEIAYEFNSKLYLKRFEDLIDFIISNNLLTPFYQKLIKGVHKIGVAITKWQSRWREHILNNINRELFELFNGDEDKIFNMLHKENLLDCRGGEIADRCYSVLVKSDDGYKRLSYAEAFKDEVSEVIKAIDELIETLSKEDDEVFSQKDEWLEYFKAIKVAFRGTNVDELVELWANVDRAWMKVKTPLQVGHPLEYYEDKYRKAVALEWDLRINKPNALSSDFIKESIKSAAIEIANSIGGVDIVDKNIKQIDQTQLYIGQPMLYYGAELNGLFSAQVVPNDVEVSKECGKKIFAYIDFVRESKKAKPIMQLGVEIFGLDFIQKERNLIENKPNIWDKIYYISTIGHEFGHILWIDDDTEVVMNRSGQFKNIEEFKATTGGIVAFFKNEDSSLIEALLDDVVSRAVNLIAWQEVAEVLPYYCEGLIHLELLYKSGVLKLDNKKVVIEYKNYNNFKEIYLDAYKNLALNYLNKVDAKEYLEKYTIKKDAIYLPKTDIIRDFVEYYYKRYKEIGNEVAKI